MSGLAYGLAATAGRGTVPFEWGVFALVVAGTVCALFAVEGIVDHALRNWKPK